MRRQVAVKGAIGKILFPLAKYWPTCCVPALASCRPPGRRSRCAPWKHLSVERSPPLFERVKAGNKRDLTQLHLQLRAIEMVAYRKGLGQKKEVALDIVGKALGVSPNTLRAWERRLKAAFGHLQIERRVAMTRNDASWIADAREKALRGVLAPEGETEVHQAEYDDRALLRLQGDWRRALRVKKVMRRGGVSASKN